MEEFKSLLAQFGLLVKNTAFYEQALIHRSYLNEVKEVKKSNERLEFLGDSVLSFIISSFLFRLRPEDEEGELTNLRAYIVKTGSLAKAASSLHLGKFLKLSKGEELSEGRTNIQILANTYEAVLGAIYLDLGITEAVNFIEKTLLPFFKEEVEEGAPRDPKSYLQEIIQSDFKLSPKYRTLSTLGPDHAKQFIVGVFINKEKLGEGQGNSKQQAEEKAAKEALKRLTRKG